MPDGNVLRSSSRSSRRADFRRQRPLSREPREGAAGHELPGRLGDDVVVGGRAPAPERGEVLLMPADLPNRQLVLLEQAGDTRPVVQQAPDPGQADQPDADLDAARPVHAGEERVRPAPRAQLVCHPARVPVVPGEVPGGCQQRQVLQPGDLPDLLDVAGLRLRAMVDPERVTVRGRPAAGHRVAEPVGLYQVGPADPEHLPLAPHELVSGRQHGRPGIPGHALGGIRRQDGGEPARARLGLRSQLRRAGHERRGGQGKLLAAHLPARPRQLDCLVAGTPGHLGG